MRVITTRLFADRNGLTQFLETVPIVRSEEASGDIPNLWRRLYEQFEASCRDGWRAKVEARWHYLKDAADIRMSEQIFLRRVGKPQDGIVSKFINRPLSRPITRLLLKFPIAPTTWTLSISALPFLSCVLLLRGDYAGILIGVAVYQLSSMLDGCDGEIARAKYLESKRGGRVDDFCDLMGGFFFMTGLGFGLGHAHGSAFYAVEGILWVLIMAANEFLLRIAKLETNLGSTDLTGALYPRHRQLIEHSGVLFFGERFVWWLLQLTKRDVGILFFLVLALAGLAPWILHLSLAIAAPGLLLTGITRIKTRAHGRGAVAPYSHL
ncbi:MAG: CDP-alcohol phosphatidyltransferase family protein [Chthoniobacterales bacterium]|nr:CDP-alcohol phosphatidyltransferase family protein [Chthoniobacterales bacterium]